MILYYILTFPTRVIAFICAIILRWRGYEYVKDKNGFYYWRPKAIT
jgi:hypothetical protein